jgi:hypothetical protein
MTTNSSIKVKAPNRNERERQGVRAARWFKWVELTAPMKEKKQASVNEI